MSIDDDDRGDEPEATGPETIIVPAATVEPPTTGPETIIVPAATVEPPTTGPETIIVPAAADAAQPAGARDDLVAGPPTPTRPLRPAPTRRPTRRTAKPRSNDQAAQPRRRLAVLAAVVIELAVIAASIALVLDIRSTRATEERAFTRARAAALQALVEANDPVLAALADVERQQAWDSTPILAAVIDATKKVNVIDAPQSSERFRRASGEVRAALTNEHSFLSALATFASAPLQADDDAAATVQSAYDALLAMQSAAAGPDDAPPPDGSGIVRAYTDGTASRAEERRRAAQISAEQEATLESERRDLQRYFESVNKVMADYESLREETAMGDAGDSIIKTTEDEEAFQAIFLRAGEARMAIVDRLEATTAPVAFQADHTLMVERLRELAQLVLDTQYAADYAYCYYDPCEPVRATSAYETFVEQSVVVYDEYAAARGRWLEAYETEFRVLHS